MKKFVVITLLVVSLLAGFFVLRSDQESTTIAAPIPQLITTPVNVPEGLAVATFAGGCFWCTEAVFQETEGVVSAISGYAGGQEPNPTYKAVYTGGTGHREAVQVLYDPAVVSFDELLALLWQAIDPTDAGGQFVDRGFPYTTAIFYHDETQKSATDTSIAELEASDRFETDVVTKVLPFTTFYEAEAYHQDYYKNAPTQYEQYAGNSGREEYKAAVWADIQKAKNQ